MTHSTKLNERLATASGFLVEAVLGSPYAWGIFVAVLTTDLYGWSKLETNSILAANLATFAFVMGRAGRVQNEGGVTIFGVFYHVSPWAQALAGGVFVTIGYLVASLHGGTSYLPILIGYGFIMGLGIGIGYGVPLAVVSHWVPKEKLGARLGFVVAGFGISSLVVITAVDTMFVGLLATVGITYTPLFEIFNPQEVGLSDVFRKLALFFIGIILIAAPFLRNPKGYVNPKSDVHHEHLNSREMRKTRTYKIIMALGTIGFGAGLMAVALGKVYPKTELVAHGVDSALMLATSALFLLLLANTFGRWFWGKVLGAWTHIHGGDTFRGAKATLMAVLGIQTLSVFLLPYTVSTPLLLVVNAIFIGLCFGGMFTLMPAVVIASFGMTYWAENYGYVFRSYGYGAIVIAMLVGGYLADQKLTNLAFAFTGFLLLGSIGLTAMLRKEFKKEEAEKDL